MPDPQQVYEVAGRLQGEAGVIGIPGMVAVLYSMWSRLCLGGSFTKGASTHEEAILVILEDYYGWDEPGSAALFLAYFLVAYPDTVPQLVEAAGLMRFDGPLPFTMSNDDRYRKDGTIWPPGDVIIEGPAGLSIHLYANWPGEKSTIGDSND